MLRSLHFTGLLSKHQMQQHTILIRIKLIPKPYQPTLINPQLYLQTTQTIQSYQNILARQSCRNNPVTPCCQNTRILSCLNIRILSWQAKMIPTLYQATTTISHRQRLQQSLHCCHQCHQCHQCCQCHPQQRKEMLLLPCKHSQQLQKQPEDLIRVDMRSLLLMKLQWGGTFEESVRRFFYQFYLDSYVDLFCNQEI